MAKKAVFFRVILGLGTAAAAVILSRKEDRDKLKVEYNKYKEDPESYKENAKEIANDLGSRATNKIQDVKNNPQAYMNKIKNDPKGFIQEQKSKLTSKKDNQKELEEVKFDDEGGSASNNLRVVTEEDLKNNRNK